MNLFSMFRSGSAPVARERLQILLAHERETRGQPDLLGVLREEILAVIARHVAFDPDKVEIRMDRGKSVSTLAVDIEIPNRRAAGAIGATGAAAGAVMQFNRLALEPQSASTAARSHWRNGLI